MRASWAAFTEALKLLGLATPFIYAGATYFCFHHLDKRASGQAKKAISSWLKPTGYDKAAVGSALVEIFDRVYTKPLLRPRAFLRSALITLGVMTIGFYESTEGRRILSQMIVQSDTFRAMIFAVLSNIVIDYASLFVVRQWLVFGRRAPFLASVVGPISGAVVVILLYSIRNALSLHVNGVARSISQFLYNLLPSFGVDGPWDGLDPYSLLLLLALVVHLWLPFLALCVVLVRVLDLILASARWMQWFLKQGQHHPLDALGYVAGALVFLGSALGRFGHYFWH